MDGGRHSNRLACTLGCGMEYARCAYVHNRAKGSGRAAGAVKRGSTRERRSLCIGGLASALRSMCWLTLTARATEGVRDRVDVRGEGRGQEAGPGDTTDQLRPNSGPVHYCVHGAYM
jgi:hypothetical protein